MKIIFTLALLALSFVSCKNNLEEKQTVTIENNFSIELPKILKETTNLNNDATLQYGSNYNGLYAIVIHEDFKDFVEAYNSEEVVYKDEEDFAQRYSLDEYENLIKESYWEANNLTITHSEEVTTPNNTKIKYTELTGKVEGLDVFYTMAMYKGKKKFYQVVMWCSANKKDKYKNEMKSAILSLKEL